MIKIRPSGERGHREYDWLDTRYTFSFNDYHDPRHMGFRALRVINEDRVQPGQGFGTHGHRDMEIITYVLEGSVAHRDSLGNGSVLRAGELQCMTAGSGIRHSEFNPSQTEPVHLYQIWIMPDQTGLPPRYDQRSISEAERRGQLRVIVSPDARDGSLAIHQDAELLITSLSAGEHVYHVLRPGRYAWVQALRGAVRIDDRPLTAGDGAAVSEQSSLKIVASEPSEVIVFDLS
jgi:redox-sensitive bicupin YhaK (pirin superfamily)